MLSVMSHRCDANMKYTLKVVPLSAVLTAGRSTPPCDGPASQRCDDIGLTVNQLESGCNQPDNPLNMPQSAGSCRSAIVKLHCCQKGRLLEERVFSSDWR